MILPLNPSQLLQLRSLSRKLNRLAEEGKSTIEQDRIAEEVEILLSIGHRVHQKGTN